LELKVSVIVILEKLITITCLILNGCRDRTVSVYTYRNTVNCNKESETTVFFYALLTVHLNIILVID